MDEEIYGTTENAGSPCKWPRNGLLFHFIHKGSHISSVSGYKCGHFVGWHWEGLSAMHQSLLRTIISCISSGKWPLNQRASFLHCYTGCFYNGNTSVCCLTSPSVCHKQDHSMKYTTGCVTSDVYWNLLTRGQHPMRPVHVLARVHGPSTLCLFTLHHLLVSLWDVIMTVANSLGLCA